MVTDSCLGRVRTQPIDAAVDSPGNLDEAGTLGRVQGLCKAGWKYEETYRKYQQKQVAEFVIVWTAPYS
jgi:hypothetical protein